MTTTYRALFTLIMLAVSLPLAAQDQPERRYRVELIVVRHLAGSSDSTPQSSLRDLSEFLDLYAPEAEGRSATAKAGTHPTRGQAAAGSGDGTPAAEGLPIEEPIAQPIALGIDDMSDAMRETWRKLKGSAGFRPELFRSWEQSGDKPFPQLRIHDDEVLYEIDPNSILGSAAVDEHGALVFSDRTIPDAATSTMGDVDNDETAVQHYYRIDGTARLTRSRYLHLDLDIELREPLYQQADPAPLVEEAGLPGADSPVAERANDEIRANAALVPAEAARRTGAAADARAFRIHRIAQKRQVKTEQMEYFDGPVIGLLVLVTGFDANSDTLDETMGVTVEPGPQL